MFHSPSPSQVSQQTVQTHYPPQVYSTLESSKHCELRLQQKLSEESFLFTELVVKIRKRVKEVKVTLARMGSILKDYKNPHSEPLHLLVVKLVNHLEVMMEQMDNIIGKNNEPQLTLKKQISCPPSMNSGGRQLHFTIDIPGFHEEIEVQMNNINISNISDILIFQNKLVKEIEIIVCKINYAMEVHHLDAKAKSIAKKLSILISKQGSISFILPFSLIMPADDLFNLPKAHKRWQQLNAHYVSTLVLAPPSQVKTTFNRFMGYTSIMVYLGVSLMKNTKAIPFLQEQHVLEESWSELANNLVSNIQNHQQLKHLYNNGNEKMPIPHWDMTNLHFIEWILNPILPSISFSKCIYIPRSNTQHFHKAIANSNFKFINSTNSQNPEHLEQLFKQKQYSSHVLTRINCNYAFKENSPNNQVKVIVHIHGGGFISMSSDTHQSYIRNWAKQLNVPFFSIDYGKSPQYPFPQALLDCVQSYLWIVSNAAKLYRSKTVKIILMGDSSGGNLCVSLLNFLIHNNLPLPENVVLFYPVLRVQIYYSPSFLEGIDDMILPHSALLKIKRAYVGDFKQAKTMYISPLYAPKKVMQKYPKMHIFSGTRDPLSDDSFRMIQKVNEAKPGNAHLTVFNDFPHGFLHFDTPHTPNYFTKGANQQIECTLKSLLQTPQQPI